MDNSRFDALARSLTEAGTRRGLLGLLGLLTSLPVLGGVVALFDLDDTEAKGRRKRRKKRHKHGKGRDKGKHKKPRCKPHPKTTTCLGKCGPVKNNCKKTVACGSCDCPDPCGDCFICQEQGPNAPAQCVIDPEMQGESCGSDGQVCQASGACACDASSCVNPTPICDSGVCIGCGDASDCAAAGGGDLCCSGSCFTGVCCEDAGCTTEEAPDCVDHACVCAPNDDTACADGETCCDDGCFNLQTNPAHCGACGEPCPAGQDCQGGVCGFACGSALCDPATEICVDGNCQSCDVLNGQSLADAIAAATAGDTLHICAGAYGKITVDKSLTLIGAGQGSDAASNTILDAARSGTVVFVDAGHTVVLRRLRITGGKVGGGAGIFNQGMLSLTDCTVTRNDAMSSAGGGIHNRNFGVLNLTNCTVSENKAAVGGGIFQNGSATITLDNTVVRLNTSTTAGAGIRVNLGAVHINNGSEITENTADGNGGGINTSDTVICDGSGSITGNKAAAGGGIYSDGTVTLNGTPVTNNNPNNCAGNPIAGCMN